MRYVDGAVLLEDYLSCHRHDPGIKGIANCSLLDHGKAWTSYILVMGGSALPIASSDKACATDSFHGPLIPQGKRTRISPSNCNLVVNQVAWSI